MSSEHIQRAVPYDMVTARLCFGPPEDRTQSSRFFRLGPPDDPPRSSGGLFYGLCSIVLRFLVILLECTDSHNDKPTQQC